MGYKYTGHTADIGFIATSNSLEGVFADCFAALANLMFDASSIAAKRSIAVMIAAGEPQALLKEFLHKPIILLDTDNFVSKEAQAISINGNALSCLIAGEPYDKSKHRFKTLVKAVTYHKLRLRQKGNQWEATVILDL